MSCKGMQRHVKPYLVGGFWAYLRLNSYLISGGLQEIRILGDHLHMLQICLLLDSRDVTQEFGCFPKVQYPQLHDTTRICTWQDRQTDAQKLDESGTESAARDLMTIPWPLDPLQSQSGEKTGQAGINQQSDGLTEAPPLSWVHFTPMHTCNLMSLYCYCLHLAGLSGWSDDSDAFGGSAPEGPALMWVRSLAVSFMLCRVCRRRCVVAWRFSSWRVCSLMRS